MSKFIHLAIATSFVLLLSLNSAFAQDVYNFYFQKSTGASEVVQVKNGGTSPSVTPAPIAPVIVPPKEEALAPPLAEPAMTSVASSVASSAAATAAVAAKTGDDEKNFWRLALSHGAFTDRQKHVSGGAISLEYGWNKYFGIQGQVMGGRPVRFYNEAGAVDRYPEEPRKNRYAGAVGIRVTPVHLQVFGWEFIEASLLGGVMSATKHGPGEKDKPSVATYAGVALALNLTRRVSILGDFKAEELEGAYGQITGGIAYRF